jgi:hypothetical protein
MHVWAGPPVDLADLQGQPQTTAVLAEATARIMAAITALLEQIRGEPAPVERFSPRKAGVPEIGPYARNTRPVPPSDSPPSGSSGQDESA